MYEAQAAAQQAAQGAGPNMGGAGPDMNAGNAAGAGADDDVIDADFKEV